MPYKKIVKIFIGSSLDEFREERRDIENFIYHISSNIFEETYDIKVKPLLCENEDTDCYPLATAKAVLPYSTRKISMTKINER